LLLKKPTDELLKRKPYSRDESIITQVMMFNICAQALFQILVLTCIILYGDILFGVPSDRALSHFEWNDVNGYHFTIFFNIFVFLQVFNSINARKLKKEELNVFEGIFDNYLYILIQLIIIAGQIIMVSFGGQALRTQCLSPMQHLMCLAIASLGIPIAYLTKKVMPDTQEVEVKGVSYSRFVGQGASSFRRSRSSTLNPSHKLNLSEGN